MSVLLGGGRPRDAVCFDLRQVFDTGSRHRNRSRKSTGTQLFAFIDVSRAAFTMLGGELVAEPVGASGQGI